MGVSIARNLISYVSAAFSGFREQEACGGTDHVAHVPPRG